MTESLGLLERSLKDKAPHLFESMTPGLSAEEIQRQLVDFDFALPQEIAGLYHWRNGQSYAIHESFLLFFTFSALKDALRSRQDLEIYYFDPDFLESPVEDPELTTARGAIAVMASGSGNDLLVPIYSMCGGSAPVFYRDPSAGTIAKCCHNVRGLVFTIAKAYELCGDSPAYWDEHPVKLSSLWRDCNDGLSPFGY